MLSDFLIENDYLRISWFKNDLRVIRHNLGSIIHKTFNNECVEEEKKIGLIKLEDWQYEKNKILKCLLWEPCNGFNLTIFITNMPDGWPSLIANYCSTFETEVISIVLSGDKVIFPMFRFLKTKKQKERLIQVIKDDVKWKFNEMGMIQDFEDPLNYNKKRIKDRLNNAIIAEYLNKNYINIRDNSFLKPKNAFAIEFKANVLLP